MQAQGAVPGTNGGLVCTLHVKIFRQPLTPPGLDTRFDVGPGNYGAVQAIAAATYTVNAAADRCEYVVFHEARNGYPNRSRVDAEQSPGFNQ